MNNIFYEKPYEEISKETMFSINPQDLVTEQNQNLPIHWHQHIEILYITEGEVLIHYNSDRLHAKSNGVVVINRDVIHAVRRANDEPVMYWVFGIAPTLLKQNQLKIDDVQFEKLINNPEITAYLDKIIYELETQQADYIQLIHCLILQCFIILKRNHRQNDSASTHKNLAVRATQSVIDYIHANFSKSFTLEDMCRAIGFSKYYISRRFKQDVGISVVDYINDYRCSQAYHLIRTTDYTISSIAKMCGYNSASYFTKIYTQQFGHTPSDALRNAAGANTNT